MYSLRIEPCRHRARAIALAREAEARGFIRPHPPILAPVRAPSRPPLEPRPPTCGSVGRGFEPSRLRFDLQVI
jgi:hypothetical protein